ncbi:MAG: CehA/McbA family metallohydrolase [Pyrinomonadaceae bacterium]
MVHLAPLGANDSRYVYVPFDVPPNAVRVSVSYQYERANGANTIDIGLFDARSTGSDTDPRGFRGWSGGRRSEFSVSRDEATPGYLPGEMTVGTWRIILGLYKVAPTGVDVSFKIEIETEENRSLYPTQASRKTGQSSVEATAVSAVRRGSRWWRGDLHMHTVHSDGDWTVAELISSAANSGLDFICITDHNTASHHAEIDRLRNGARQPLVLRGEEITTYGGHTNAWGLPSGKWIDFRVRAGDNARMSNVAAETRRAGAIISINHPFALCGGCAWSYDQTARGFDAIEVWNGTWDATDEQALTMWDKILQSGRHITAIASSDSHRQVNAIGQPTTHVAANGLSQTALLNSIRQGHVYLTGEVARPVVSFEAEAARGKRRARSIIGDEVRLSTPATIKLFIITEAAPPDATISLISNGDVIRRLTAAPDARPQVVEIECRRDSYFRLEVRDKAGSVLALTNPIYVKVGTGQ